jgi:hypothetical protein
LYGSCGVDRQLLQIEIRSQIKHVASYVALHYPVNYTQIAPIAYLISRRKRLARFPPTINRVESAKISDRNSNGIN